MDPNELIKAAPGIARVVVPAAASIPFTSIVKRMLGPAADELAEMWRDQVRLYRYERQVKWIEKAEKMAADAGFSPNEVPPKILFPLLEGASMEHDETLHTMWAALLANASSRVGRVVRPSFVSLLREMAADEAVLLQSIADRDGRLSDLYAACLRYTESAEDSATVEGLVADLERAGLANPEFLQDEMREWRKTTSKRLLGFSKNDTLEDFVLRIYRNYVKLESTFAAVEGEK